MRVFFAALVMVLLGSGVAKADLSDKNPESARECAICHYEWMDQFLYEFRGTDLVPFQSERIVADPDICFSCHDGTVIDSRIRVWASDIHAVNVSPPTGMTIPESLPLTDGKLACRTCHTAHGTGDPAAPGAERSVFLRHDNPNSELCVMCHADRADELDHPFAAMNREASGAYTDTDGMLGAVDNEAICQSCHTPHAPAGEHLLVGDFDESDMCNACHTDKIHPDDNAYVMGVMAHPIHIQVKDIRAVSRMKKAGGRFTGAAGDELMCLSCHHPHDGVDTGLLVKDNRNDGLCLTCHSEKSSARGGPHDTEKMDNLTDVLPHDSSRGGTCRSCHGPHGWATDLVEGDEDLMTRGCVTCHSTTGPAAEKPIDLSAHNHPVGVVMKPRDKSIGLPVFGRVFDFISRSFDVKPQTRITCASCHDLHGTDKTLLRADAESGKLCLTCHDGKDEITDTVHAGKDMTRNCLSCHDVHNADNPRLLIGGGANDGCIDCHSPTGAAKEKLIGDHSHPVGMVPKTPLPEPFILNRDGLFSCVSCHDPHRQTKSGRVKVDFLRLKSSTTVDFCATCHTGKEDVIGSDHDVAKRNEPVCASCHGVHNAGTERFLMTPEFDYKKDDDACLVCHTKDGQAEKKPVMGGHPLGTLKAPFEHTEHLTVDNGTVSIDCGNCHDPHRNGPDKGDEGGFDESFLKTLKADTNLCVSCHTAKAGVMNTKHAPANMTVNDRSVDEMRRTGHTCGVCHQAHNSGAMLMPKGVGDDAVDRCTWCHGDDGIGEDFPAKKGHPVGVDLPGGMNAHGLPLSDGRIRCTSCHEPHRDAPAFARNADDNAMELCVTCHGDKKSLRHNEHFMVVAGVGGSAEETAAKNGCGVCHQMHNLPDDSPFLWPTAMNEDAEGDAIQQSCLSCHTDGGVASDKPVEFWGHPRIPVTFPRKGLADRLIFDFEGRVDADMGRITCTTCHQPHRWAEKDRFDRPGRNEEGSAVTSFLRYRDVMPLCIACHDTDGLSRYKYYHTMKERRSEDEKREKTKLEKLLGI